MLMDIKVGDIMSPDNEADVIIGMNTNLKDVIGIGRPYVEKITAAYPVKLGSVISFRFATDENKRLHMLICHTLGRGGWAHADRHVRFGLDYLEHTESPYTQFSIVDIGNGRVGRRDGASHAAIKTAMATSFLPVTLYVWNQPLQEAAAAEIPSGLIPYRVWNTEDGAKQISAAA